MTYVVIACHFASPIELCDTTKLRLARARALYKTGDRIIVTGDVPYQKGGKTLGQLMEAWLVQSGVPKEAVTRLNGGVGTFSEAELVCKLLFGKTREFTIVSSPWYLFQAKPIWNHQVEIQNESVPEEAYETPISPEYLSVPGTGGLRTWIIYIGIGIVVRASILCGQAGRLAELMTESQQDRVNGFKFNGCK